MSLVPVLKVKNLSTHFHTRHGIIKAVDGVSFEVAAGKTLGLVGESGCGKSVTALSILRLIEPPGRILSGEVWLNGYNLLKLPPGQLRQVRGKEIALVFQDPLTSLNPVLTIGTQITETIVSHEEVSRAEARRRAVELLFRLGLPDPERLMRLYPFQLSGGMRQRVMMAMAISMRPKVLIADEPTTALDVTVQAQILAELKRLQEELGMAIVLITHDLGVVASMADEVAVMYAGSIVERGPVAEVFDHPAHPYTRALLRSVPRLSKEELVPIGGQPPTLLNFPAHCAFFPRCPEAHTECRGKKPELREIGPDHAAACHRISRSCPGGGWAQVTLLEVREVVKHYAGKRGIFAGHREKVRAVDGVTFALARGETLSLVGESGCGKSTLGRLVVRLEEPTAGKILFAGEDITGWTGRKLQELRRRFQIIFQDSSSSLNPRRTVGAIIEEPLANFGVAKRERQERVAELLTLVGLEPGDAWKYPHEFSGGQRQRINIARALALQPELVVCDEPVSSLDVSIRAQILNLLRELKKRLGLSYLFISHDLAAVNYLADRVAVMYLGKIVEILPAEGLGSQARHPYTRALLRAVPEPDPRQRTDRKAVVRGEPPDPANPPAGCRFHPRCPEFRDICRREEPTLKEVREGHLVACHLGEACLK